MFGDSCSLRDGYYDTRLLDNDTLTGKVLAALYIEIGVFLVFMRV
ncbi:MAG: hypothetical protein ABWX61_06735 [Paenisporosarcina sp.]